MTNKNWLKEFRRQIGSTDFEGKDFSVMAQVIYHFIFTSAPEKERLALFEDFIVNFWTELTPKTNAHYLYNFKPISENVMRGIAERIQNDLLRNLKNLSDVQRFDGRQYAHKVFLMIKDMDYEEAIFSIYILLISERYVPYRFMPIYPVVTIEEMYSFANSHQETWMRIGVLIEGFNSDSIGNALQLLQIIELNPSPKEQAILMFLSAAATVYLTRNYRLYMGIDREEDLPNVQAFEKTHDFFIQDCFVSLKQERSSYRKFRNFLDQAAYILSEIKRFKRENRHMALFFALNAFFTQAANGQENLPVCFPIPEETGN